jgi:hypothetical protein
MVLYQLNGSPGGKVASGLVGGAQFQRRDQFAIALQLRLRQHPRLAVVGTVRGVRLLTGPSGLRCCLSLPGKFRLQIRNATEAIGDCKIDPSKLIGL